MKVTIGIPFYNNEKTLDYAIKSVVNQTFRNWELFLIDDGSTDGSVLIAQEAASEEPRIKLYVDGTNRGLVFRLNQIIDTANGDYIARMDADDIMLPERIEKQLAVFFNDSLIDVVSTATYTIDEKNNPIGVRQTECVEIKGNINVFKKPLITHPSIMARKNWCQENKYNSKYIRAEDFELWCRTFAYTNFYRITEPLLLYREGKVNIKNYVLSMKTTRLVLKNHSKGYLTVCQFSIEVLKTYLKSALYQIVGFFGLQALLTAKRNSLLDDNQKKSIVDFLNELKSNKFYNAN